MDRLPLRRANPTARPGSRSESSSDGGANDRQACMRRPRTGGRARSKGKFWICQVLQKAPGLLRTSRPNPTSTTARDGEVDEAVEPTNADDEAKPTTSHSADRSANSGGGETQGFFVFPLVFCLLT